MALTAADVVGAWELADFRVSFDDGRAPIAPFGEDARGQLIYSASGRMSAVLSAGEREPLSIEGLERSAKATDAEKAAAFDTYLSYSGRYHVSEDSVVHTVELGLVPNIVGKQQVRTARVDGDELTLAYDLATPRGLRHYTLRWRRV